MPELSGNFLMKTPKVLRHICSVLIGLGLATSVHAQSIEALMTKAVKDNDIAAFKSMVGEGADPNAGMFGNALINTASLQGRAEIVAFMLENGVDPLVYDNGFAPIHLAVNGDHADVVGVYLDAGVPMNLATEEAWEPPLLMLAARSNSVKTINFLLDRGADINMRDKCNDPAIAAAAARGKEDALRLFIERGADLTTKSGTGAVCIPGATAVFYARRNGHDHIAEILLEAGAIE